MKKFLVTIEVKAPNKVSTIDGRTYEMDEDFVWEAIRRNVEAFPDGQYISSAEIVRVTPKPKKR